MKKLLIALITAFGFVCSAHALYLPSGPQTNVSLSTVLEGGWTQCYAQTMSVGIGSQAQNVLTGCNGDFLMMAGRQTGSDSFLVLAAADLDETIFNTGATSITHLANGSNWWFSNNWSWGFTAANDTVSNFSCDTSNSPTSMCLHTLDNVGGYRINSLTGLNGSADYEKVFFMASNADVSAVPEPTSIALLGLGLLGFAAARRKSAK
ncbi:MAG: PEP-CTERM sorting domain-containing protein [Pseudomonadota bacterium]